jgi:hypothetical protein
LKNMSHFVICDEAHTLRKPLNTFSQIVLSLNAKFHLLNTAPPFFNRIQDIAGFVPFGIPAENERLYDEHGVK